MDGRGGEGGRVKAGGRSRGGGKRGGGRSEWREELGGKTWGAGLGRTWGAGLGETGGAGDLGAWLWRHRLHHWTDREQTTKGVR